MSHDRPQGLVPHLVVKDAAGAIEFYKKAFGAQELARMPEENGTRLMHAHLTIDGEALFLCDDFPDFCGGKSSAPGPSSTASVTIHRYVPDVDAAYKRAIDAGATATMPPSDMFWGDRYGRVRDPYGHEWSLATPLKP